MRVRDGRFMLRLAILAGLLIFCSAQAPAPCQDDVVPPPSSSPYTPCLAQQFQHLVASLVGGVETILGDGADHEEPSEQSIEPLPTCPQVMLFLNRIVEAVGHGETGAAVRNAWVLKHVVRHCPDPIPGLAEALYQITNWLHLDRSTLDAEVVLPFTARGVIRTQNGQLVFFTSEVPIIFSRSGDCEWDATLRLADYRLFGIGGCHGVAFSASASSGDRFFSTTLSLNSFEATFENIELDSVIHHGRGVRRHTINIPRLHESFFFTRPFKLCAQGTLTAGLTLDPAPSDAVEHAASDAFKEVIPFPICVVQDQTCPVDCQIDCGITIVEFPVKIARAIVDGKTLSEDDVRRDAADLATKIVRQEAFPKCIAGTNEGKEENIAAHLRKQLSTLAPDVASRTSRILTDTVPKVQGQGTRNCKYTLRICVWYIIFTPNDEAAELLRQKIFDPAKMANAAQVKEFLVQHELGHVAIDLANLRSICAAVGKERYPDSAEGFKSFRRFAGHVVGKMEEQSGTKQATYDEIKTKEKDATPESFKTENANASKLGTEVLTYAKDQKFITPAQFDVFAERIKVIANWLSTCPQKTVR